LQIQPKEQIGTPNEFRRLEEDLRVQKQRYDNLLNDFEKYKRDTSDRTRETFRERSNDDQMRLFETLIDHLKEESANQNRASMDLLNSMIAKMDDRKKTGGNEEGNRMLE
jgi:predicted component of type VI protein secretion system